MKKLSLALLLSVCVHPAVSATPCAQACAAACAAVSARCQECGKSTTDSVDTETCASECTKTWATKTCPFSNQGLTWEKAARSDTVFISMERLSATAEAWEHIVRVAKDRMPNMLLSVIEENDNVMYKLERGSMTEDEWLNVIMVLMSTCKDLRDAFDKDTKCRGAQMSIYVNRVNA